MPAPITVVLLASAFGLPVTVETDAPRLLIENPAPLLMLANRREYDELRREVEHVEIVRWPAAVSPEIPHALVPVAGGLTLLLERAAEGGARALLDTDADGGLDDEQWSRLEPRRFFGELDTYVAAFEVRGAPLLVAWIVDPGGTPGNRALVFARSERRGRTTALGDALTVALVGEPGGYDDGTAEVFFDLDGNGSFDRGDVYDEERFLATDGAVRIADAVLTFSVSPDGDRIDLFPAPGKDVRPDLSLGAEAPDFALPGPLPRLADYRGRPLMVYFWFEACAPCRKLKPLLLDARRRHHAAGFEIVAINSHDDPELIEEVPPWVRVMRDAGAEAVARRYRVRGWPTWFLVDRAGRIVGHTTSRSRLPAAIDDLVAGPPP